MILPSLLHRFTASFFLFTLQNKRQVSRRGDSAVGRDNPTSTKVSNRSNRTNLNPRSLPPLLDRLLTGWLSPASGRASARAHSGAPWPRRSVSRTRGRTAATADEWTMPLPEGGVRKGEASGQYFYPLSFIQRNNRIVSAYEVRNILGVFDAPLPHPVCIGKLIYTCNLPFFVLLFHYLLALPLECGHHIWMAPHWQ